ncbi:MAG: flagellar biosynthesis regulator FlaF [Rhodospirillales bacterium]|nr:flagellar biosynthesis regulator FlaF [Rhodospirillales bacterium]
MNTQNKPGYTTIPQPGSARHTEAWALIEAARRIAVSIENFASTDQNDQQAKLASKRAMRDAVRLNWRLWTIFQAEILEDTCPLPTEIRSNLLNLCKFVDEHTIRILGEISPEKMKTLIDINRNIASGLLEAGGEIEPGEAANEQPLPEDVGSMKLDV